VVEAGLPALVTFSKGEVVRRAPSFKDVLEARKKLIRTIRADAIAIPEEQLGLQGSFTQVVKVFPPPAKKSSNILQNLEADKAAQEIFDFLKEKRFI
jgi:electron transfer flavoprotein beta subunit